MVSEEVGKIVLLLDGITEDTSVPRNVRTRITEAKKKLESNEDFAAKVSSAVYTLDDISNDINLPMHARTLIWNILSELETLKNKALQEHE